MSVDDLLQAATNFEKLAKDTKKLDPKAKVRNRPDPVVPASRAKDHKDHFPLGSIDQARNALSQVAKYDKAPPWYSGSLKGLQDLVSRKVHSKYPGIGKDNKKKKSFLERLDLLSKYGQVYSPAGYETGDPNPPETPAAPAPVETPASAAAAPIPQKPKYPYIPKDIQEGLNKLLGTKLVPDTQLGPATNAALTQFRAKYNVSSQANNQDVYNTIRYQIKQQASQSSASGTQQSSQKINNLISWSQKFINKAYQDIAAARQSGQGLQSNVLGQYVQTVQQLYPQIEALQSLSLDENQKANVQAIIGSLDLIEKQLSSATALNVNVPRTASLDVSLLDKIMKKYAIY